LLLYEEFGMSLGSDFKPRLLGFLCNWCVYAAADGAGVSRIQYPSNLRVIRVMCSGRVDPTFVLDGLLHGYDGVLVAGCHPKDCHYLSGNYEALNMINLWKKVLEEIGIDPKRLQIGLASADEGVRFAKIISDFTNQLSQLGPLWTGKEENIQRLKLKIEATKELIPYIKLVGNNKIRLSAYGEEVNYEEFFSREQVNKVFHEMIADKLTLGEILSLLRGKYFSIKEISEILNISSSKVSNYLIASAKRGLVRSDESRQRFTVAGSMG
jgi:F420-non-reducing hydrogenase iron-sulfur subunit